MHECDGQMNIFDFIEPVQKVTHEWTCSFTTPVIDNGKPAFKRKMEKLLILGITSQYVTFQVIFAIKNLFGKLLIC